MTHLFKNLFRFAAFSMVFLAVMLLCVHLWFKYNSERTIEQLVRWGSGGKLGCSIEKIQTDYFSNAIHIKGISIYTVNSSQQATSYRFNVKDFHFQTRSRWDLFAHRQLLIDSIVFNRPEILIGKSTALKVDSTQRIALLQDLEKLYSSIYKSLDVLNLQLFKINDGRLVITNEHNRNRPPLVVNHIHFSINKLRISSSQIKDPSRFIFSERVLLRITDQKIMLDDNKSNIVFKELLIDSKERLVRLRGAAMRIFPSLQWHNSAGIRAQKLSIIGLDFNTLYQKQLVQADSVFLENPFIASELFVGGKYRKSSRNDKRALFDRTINQLPVGFSIGHVVMQNGSVLMNLHQGGKISRFSAVNDNVSISGFHLNDTVKKELTIGGFRYTIRNYTGFLPDSLLQLRFDSLQFINDKIVLHNLLAQTPPNVRSSVIRNYKVPRFEITGMDWLAFIFHNNFKAHDAVMYYPVLRSEQNLLISGPAKKAKRSIYQNLSLMDKIIDLEKLRIVGGDVSLKRGNSFELRLQNLNLSIHVSKLGKARSPDELVGSLKQLTFGKAAVNTASVMVVTGPSVFDENGQKLVFDSIRAHTKNGDIAGIFKKVQVQDFSYENNQLDINSLQWETGAVSMDGSEPAAAVQARSSRTLWFVIEKMSGNNTRLSFKGKNLSAHADLQNLSANKISREKDSNLQTQGLHAKGRTAGVSTAQVSFQTGDFDIGDKEKSVFHSIIFHRQSENDSLLVKIPILSLTPYLEKSLVGKSFIVDSVAVDNPLVNYTASGAQNLRPISSFNMPAFDISHAAVDKALFNLNIAGEHIVTKDVSVSAESIRAARGSFVLARQIFFQMGGLKENNPDRIISSDKISAKIDHFNYDPRQRTWETKLDQFKTNQLCFEKNQSGQKTFWSARRLQIENLKANQNDFKAGINWFVNSSGAGLNLDSLQLHSESSHLDLAGLEFNGMQHKLTVHSLWVNPAKSKADFYKDLVYRKIYLRARTGEIQFRGVELTDKGLHITNAGADSSVLWIYADKTKKFGPPMIQPLPVAALRKIGFPFQIDQMQLFNSSVHYTELSPVSADTGSVDFSAVNAKISHVFSEPSQGSDSLRVDVSALFLDKMKLRAQMSQSYQDTLSGLLLNIDLGAGHLNSINPFLAPLLSARIRSGYLDSMHMSATGNDYVSKGIMKLRFHGLRAELLDSGNVQRRSFRSRLIGLIANTVAIKNKNAKKEASFTFVRNREKPVIVYFLRMVVGGCAGSIAPISNFVFRKQYKKAIQDIPAHARLL